ncbi:uncharacterized protein TNCV_4494351 [Trichonephila clavipes]|nr:uncharacterized protein TNCV_4494351 [Trichonephila clavipes]
MAARAVCGLAILMARVLQKEIAAKQFSEYRRRTAVLFGYELEGRMIRSGYLPFRTNASTLPITPKRSSSRDVGISSYRYHTATYSPDSVSANRRTKDTIFVASMLAVASCVTV